MDTNKFNANYNDWLRNLKIVLDFENQDYVLDKPLPTTLPEGSSPEERLTFDKWLEDNRKVLERSRKLSKDEMILRLGDGKTVAAEAVGSLGLVGKITKKLFVGQSAIASNLLDLAIQTYKSETFGRFKEYKLEVENQTGRKIKALRSDPSGEYLSGEFIDYLKENEIFSHWTPPGTLQLNGVTERRNRTLLDMVRSIMSFKKLPPSFRGYVLEMNGKFLNIVPSKTVPQTSFEIWHGKHSRRDEALLEESSKEPQHDCTISFEPPFSLIVFRSSLDQPENLEYLRDVRLVGCKWIYKRKLGANEEVTTFKARLAAKGYTQRPEIDFEETYSRVAMDKSIRILLAIAA
ncbi:UNVERIFIED_CONTAM: Retrovirus-related Pol polyprotein from transposon RE2 [Sesamum radiatum]|uniref:Retrovirus-related Pol polyprotein from transposon RE2 n=1 Tax=Sesamum radiatum TaxID=300843 RepID=A0AAW2REN9_SESRA